MDSIDLYWETKGLDMQSDTKRQKVAEKKRKKREVKREIHLKQRIGEQALAEHDHMIRFHTSPEDLTPEQQAHPGEEHATHEVGTDAQRQQQINSPLDVGTTRMKIDGFDGPSTPGGPAEESRPQSIEELRESLGLR